MFTIIKPLAVSMHRSTIYKIDKRISFQYSIHSFNVVSILRTAMLFPRYTSFRSMELRDEFITCYAMLRIINQKCDKFATTQRNWNYIEVDKTYKTYRGSS